MYTVLVCDDDEISLEVNQKYIELFGKRLKKQLRCVPFKEYTEELEQLITQKKIDIAMLDIQFPNRNGIEIARQLQTVNSSIPIMFVTNFTEYKSVASDMIAVGYLEKPVVPQKMEIILKRAIGQIDQEEEQTEFLEICVNRKDTIVRFYDIIDIEIIQKKLIINTKKGKLTCRETMQSIEKKLPTNFMRISQSVIVNIHCVLQMDMESVLMTSGDTFTIGRTFLKSVREKYKQYV